MAQNKATFTARSRIRDNDRTFEAFRYDPNSGVMPQGFRAQTTSQGPRAILPRSDGLHWTMAPFDVALRTPPSSHDPLGGEWICIAAPAFDELFEEVK